MLSDLVSASGGAPDEDTGIGLVASFQQPSEAFRAAKRIQWSVLEYSQQRPEDCLGAAIAVYHASDLHRGEAAQGIVALLEQAKPSQIFLASNAAKLLEDVPGLQLRKRAGPSLASSELEREAQELIWTTPQTQRRVQELLKQAARKVTPRPDLAEASEPTVDITREAIRPTTGQIRAALFRVDHPSGTEPAPMGTLGEGKATEDSGASKSRLLWWLLPAFAVLAVVAVLLFLSQTYTKPVLPDAPVTAQQPAPKVAPETLAPSLQKPVTEQPPPPPEAKTPMKPVPPERVPQPKIVAKVSEYEGFSEKDIPVLIRMAESDAGAGNYANARSEYEIILHLDPNNATAKQGVHKLSLSEQHSR